MKKKRKNRARLENLTPLEEEIMRTVWELKECSSAEVLEAHERIRKQL